jgi:hypothetical protein
MMSSEIRTRRLSLFGRLADDLTRQVILPPDMHAILESDGRPALAKSDGYFAFGDLQPSTAEYRIQIGARACQQRTVARALPVGAPVEVKFAGEDELYLTITTVAAAQKRVTFEQIAFVAPITDGAAVFGQSGFTATLAEPLEGQKVTFATLSTVAGLAPNQLLRIVRSSNLLVRPGPYYAFQDDATVIALKIVGNDQGESAIADARVEISKINGNAPAASDVGGLALNAFTLGANSSLVLDDDDRTTMTNERGDAVIYFPGSKPVTGIEVKVSKPRFQPSVQTLNVTAAARNSQKIVLAKL